MFVISIKYKAPLEAIDAVMKEHVLFLKKHYKAGNFIMSGRKIPRTGGIIIATATDKKSIMAIMKQDPFYVHKLASFAITEFSASQSIPILKDIIK